MTETVPGTAAPVRLVEHLWTARAPELRRHAVTVAFDAAAGGDLDPLLWVARQSDIPADLSERFRSARSAHVRAAWVRAPGRSADEVAGLALSEQSVIVLNGLAAVPGLGADDVEALARTAVLGGHKRAAMALKLLTKQVNLSPSSLYQRDLLNVMIQGGLGGCLPGVIAARPQLAAECLSRVRPQHEAVVCSRAALTPGVPGPTRAQALVRALEAQRGQRDYEQTLMQVAAEENPPPEILRVLATHEPASPGAREVRRVRHFGVGAFDDSPDLTLTSMAAWYLDLDGWEKKLVTSTGCSLDELVRLSHQDSRLTVEIKIRLRRLVDDGSVARWRPEWADGTLALLWARGRTHDQVARAARGWYQIWSQGPGPASRMLSTRVNSFPPLLGRLGAEEGVGSEIEIALLGVCPSWVFVAQETEVTSRYLLHTLGTAGRLWEVFWSLIGRCERHTTAGEVATAARAAVA